MMWRSHEGPREGQGPQQSSQQWSRPMQNGQKFESVLWRMEVNVNKRVAYCISITQPRTYKVCPQHT